MGSHNNGNNSEVLEIEASKSLRISNTNNCMKYFFDRKSPRKQEFMDFVNNCPMLKSFLTGAFSGTCSSLLFQPLDLVKTRLQNANSSSQISRGMFALVLQVAKDEKVIGLWKGTIPSIARCVPGVGMYFCSLNMLQSVSGKHDPSPLEAMCLGVLARSLAGISLLPVTVIKTRYESGIYAYGSISEALKVIYRTEGTKGLYSGLIPTLVRDAPFSGLYLLFYTQSKKLLPNEWRSSSYTPMLHFSCGIVAGFVASTLTHPADVIKTKMQLYPIKFNSCASVVTFIYKENGVRGFFNGLLPRVLRRTLMAAMAWTIYEQVMRGVSR